MCVLFAGDVWAPFFGAFCIFVVRISIGNVILWALWWYFHWVCKGWPYSDHRLYLAAGSGNSYSSL